MKILINRQHAIGDVLATTPIIARLRYSNHGATIDICTFKPEVYLRNRYVTRVIDFCNSEKYDRFIDLDMAEAKRLRRMHPVDAFSEEAFGDRKTVRTIRFFFWRRQALRLIVIHPAQTWANRTLPWDWWQGLIDGLNRRGHRVGIVGTMADHGDFHGDVEDFRGCNLADTASIIDASRCFIGSDAGPLILAQATKAPVIGLTTIKPPEFLRYREHGVTIVQAPIPCAGCETEVGEPVTHFDCRFGHRNCVTSFDAEKVAALAARVS